MELKYLLNEDMARLLREQARANLELDPYGAGQADFSYPVHSLYLDSDALDSYWATVQRRRDRFKLRIRFYCDDAAEPAFVEIKRHVDGITYKQRYPIDRRELPAILERESVGFTFEIPDNSSRSVVLGDFIERVRALEAGPKLHVAYYREAYVSAEDNSVRLTFDRKVRSEPVTNLRISTNMRGPLPLCKNLVVVEFKCSGPTPAWFEAAASMLGLQTRNFAKYVTGVVRHSLFVSFTRLADERSKELDLAYRSK